MRILHVSLGWPPFRTGGLVRYCCDLMDAQTDAGHIVAMLYPAGNSLTKRARIRKEIVEKKLSYALYSLNTVPLVFGIKNPRSLDCSEDDSAYAELLDDFRPAVIHIHSAQGIGESFFYEAKRRGIKLVFTTHDYYPLCLRCNLVNYCGQLCSGPSPRKCAVCNSRHGLSDVKARLMQTKAYRHLKDSKAMQEIRRNVKWSLSNLKNDMHNGPMVTEEQVIDFDDTIARSKRIIESVDTIHANSELSANCYEAYFPGTSINVIPITHSGLDFSPVRVCSSSNKLTVGYVGGANEYKGYKILLEALNMVAESIDWSLLFYGTPLPAEECQEERVHCMGFFDSGAASEVYSGMDLLVVPSIWPETFSFVTIEALCAGTPVICSDNVGAACLLPHEFVYDHTSAKALAKAIERFCSSSHIEIDLPEGYSPKIDLHARAVEALYA